jgi:hypothetical protein
MEPAVDTTPGLDHREPVARSGRARPPGAQGGTASLPEERHGPLLPREVAVSIALERYTVAMSLTAFMVILAAALMYQGAVSADRFLEYSLAGFVSLIASGVIFVVARLRLRGRLVAYGRKRGFDDDRARANARREMDELLRSWHHGRRNDRS